MTAEEPNVPNVSIHAELLARHREVLPDWLALYYDQPIALVSTARAATSSTPRAAATSTSSAGSSPP